MNDHIGDDAALYALGTLEDAERATVDAHVAGCESCLRLLGEAERDATRLFEREVRHPAPHRVVPLIRPRSRAGRQAAVAAVAAVLVLGVLPSAYFWQQNRAMQVAMHDQAAAMRQLASASFRSADFSGSTPARVMYARDGSWYVVVIRDARRALRVAWMHDGSAIDLGAAVPHGEVAMLYLPHSHVMHRLALTEAGVVVAEARLTYGSKVSP